MRPGPLPDAAARAGARCVHRRPSQRLSSRSGPGRQALCSRPATYPSGPCEAGRRPFAPSSCPRSCATYAQHRSPSLPISVHASPLSALRIIPSQRTILASTEPILKPQRAKIQILSPLRTLKGLLTSGNTGQEPFRVAWAEGAARQNRSRSDRWLPHEADDNDHPRGDAERWRRLPRDPLLPVQESDRPPN